MFVVGVVVFTLASGLCATAGSVDVHRLPGAAGRRRRPARPGIAGAVIEAFPVGRRTRSGCGAQPRRWPPGSGRPSAAPWSTPTLAPGVPCQHPAGIAAVLGARVTIVEMRAVGEADDAGPAGGVVSGSGRAPALARTIVAPVTSFDADALRDHCLAKPGAWADQPWDGDYVAKVGDKIFAFLGSDSVGLKCGANRAEADEWLLQFPDDASVMPYIGRSGLEHPAAGWRDPRRRAPRGGRRLLRHRRRQASQERRPGVD